MKQLLSAAAAALTLAAAAAEKKMEPPFIPFENAVAVTDGVQRDTVPSDRLFAEKGKSIRLGAPPWDMEKFTGKEPAGSMLVRVPFTVPRDGFYTLGGGADWFLTVWIDGVRYLDDVVGDVLSSVLDHRVLVELKAGEHTLDFRFSRGSISAQMALGLQWYGTKRRFGADLTAPEGNLNKALHGSNTTLLLSSRKLHRYDEDLRRLHFTLSRTHDWALWNPGQRIIDTHFIFPLMRLDPKDPANYYFDATDEIIRLTQEEGQMEVFYRLGTSIEHTGDPHFNILPPADYAKYAEVLAGIVRHYTRGWANGHHYNIRCWEIWNEPDGVGITNMWAAPYDTTFVPFFVTVLKRLKSEFPELQFGGPALTGAKGSKKHLFKLLLDECRKAGTAPDFLSWHHYGQNPDTLINQPVKIRAFLDEQGFPETKLCINEWHYLESWQGVQSFSTPEEYVTAQKKLNGIHSAVYNLAVLAGWQYTPLDLAMWYGSNWDSPAWGYRDVFKRYTKNYYSMELFGRFLKNYSVKCHADSLNSTRILAGASADGKRAGILAADFKGELAELQIPVRGLEKYSGVSAVILDETRNNEAVPVSVRDGCLILKKAKPGSAAFLVSLEK